MLTLQGRQSDSDTKTGRKGKEIEDLVTETVKGKPELVREFPAEACVCGSPERNDTWMLFSGKLWNSMQLETESGQSAEF